MCYRYGRAAVVSRGRRDGRVAFIALMATAMISAAGAAQTITWIGPDGGDWSEPTNWSPAVVPDGATVVVVIGAGASVVHSTGTHEVSVIDCAGALDLSGGTISIGDASSIATFVMSGGFRSGAGEVTVETS
ncbi:MAG: hypothetical protein ACYTF9_06685, partial [Planctomycetota bacterium]